LTPISIEPTRCPSARPLFEPLSRHNLCVLGAFQGDSTAALWVDDVQEPRFALLCMDDSWFVAGDATDTGLLAEANALLPIDEYFVLVYEGLEWEAALGPLLAKRYAVSAQRVYSVLQRPLMTDWRQRLPDGYEMVSVDGALFERSDLRNVSVLDEWVEECWSSRERFEAIGWGRALIHGDEIVSWSLLDYVSGRRAEIGIITDWAYRRQGFGALTAAANVEACLDQGMLEIGWHCWRNNAGSLGVAKSVGIFPRHAYNVRISHWPAENPTDMTRDEYLAFAQRYRRWLADDPPLSGYPYLNEATAWDLAGRTAEGIQAIVNAAACGWLTSVEQLYAQWPPFVVDGFKEEPGWQAVEAIWEERKA